MINEKFQLKKSAVENRQLFLLAYNLLTDILLFLILFFIATLLLEAVLPGMVSQNNGLFILTFLILINMFFISILGKKLNIEFANKQKHNILPFFLVCAFILIGNSLLKFSLWENILITTSTLLIFFILHQAIFSKQELSS